jgi:cell division protein FtsB
MIVGSKRDVESAGCCIVRSSDGSLYVVGNDIADRLNRYEDLEKENEHLKAEVERLREQVAAQKKQFWGEDDKEAE